MLEYDRINMSEGIDANITKKPCRYIICNYYYFLSINFRFQPKTCDSCHASIQKPMSFNNIAIFFC